MVSTSPLLNFVLRGFQIVFASVVLGLSVGLVRAQIEGSASPISLRYCSFVGGLSFLGAIIGMAAEWRDLLQGNIGLLIDAVVALVNIAGGVVRYKFFDTLLWGIADHWFNSCWPSKSVVLNAVTKVAKTKGNCSATIFSTGVAERMTLAKIGAGIR